MLTHTQGIQSKDKKHYKYHIMRAAKSFAEIKNDALEHLDIAHDRRIRLGDALEDCSITALEYDEKIEAIERYEEVYHGIIELADRYL